MFDDPFVVLVPPGRWVSNVPFPVVVDPWCDRHRARCGPVPVAAPTRSLVEATAELVAMIDEGVFTQESEGERRLAPLLRNLDPPPLWQYWVAPGRRVDCLLADVPLIIEYLGDVAHGQPHQRARDHGRNRELETLGYTVLEVTVRDLDQPEVLRVRILGLRAGLLAAGARRPRR